MLRKNGTPEICRCNGLGIPLRTTGRYLHTHQELEYRPVAASKAGLNFIVGPELDQVDPIEEVGKSHVTH